LGDLRRVTCSLFPCSQRCQAEEFKRIRSDIFIPVVVIPECANPKPFSWNPARGFSYNREFLAVWNRIDTSMLFSGFDRR
jgi:hypothetical protein